MYKKLKTNNTYDLISIGSRFVGGYLVEKKSYEDSEFLLSLGICDDWNFEVDFRKPFLGIDNQLSKKFLSKKIFIKACRVIMNPLKYNSYRTLYVYLKKLYFYLLNSNFFKRAFVSNFDSAKTISLSKIISSVKKRNIFLKIDIEGSEYRILKEILENENIIEGLVIEFHDVDLHLDKILNFIDQTILKLVHFHPNNYGGTDKNGDPLIIELTFAKTPKIISNKPPSYPHNLDAPNNNKEDDIKVKFNSGVLQKPF